MEEVPKVPAIDARICPHIRRRRHESLMTFGGIAKRSESGDETTSWIGMPSDRQRPPAPSMWHLDSAHSARMLRGPAYPGGLLCLRARYHRRSGRLFAVPASSYRSVRPGAGPFGMPPILYVSSAASWPGFRLTERRAALGCGAVSGRPIATSSPCVGPSRLNRPIGAPCPMRHLPEDQPCRNTRPSIRRRAVR